MIPPFNQEGRLPPGIHSSNWQEFADRFGTTPYRLRIISGLRMAVDALRNAQCETVYIDGSFVTTEPFPNDFDACWSAQGVDVGQLDPVFLDFANGRAAQKSRFFGELFPAEATESTSGLAFVNFFQVDKNTGEPKGIVVLDLRRLP